MEITKVPIEELIPFPGNPRANLKEDLPGIFKTLTEEIKLYGFVQPLVVNQRTNHVVGGNQRLDVYKELGHTHADVVYVDLSETEEKKLNLALNKLSGDWDLVKLKDMLKDLQDEDLELTGFADELDAYLELDDYTEPEIVLPEITEEDEYSVISFKLLPAERDVVSVVLSAKRREVGLSGKDHERERGRALYLLLSEHR